MSTARPASVSPRVVRLLDVGGMLVSSLCAVHCALTPLILVALPFLGGPFLGWQALEGWLRAAAIVVGVSAIGGGAWFHRSARAVPALIVGVALLASASMLHGTALGGWGLLAEVAVSIAASVALLRAHWLNTRACAAVCHDCPPARAMVDAAAATDLEPEHSTR